MWRSACRGKVLSGWPFTRVAGTNGSSIKAMDRSCLQRWSLMAVRILLGGAFVAAGLLKMASPESFATSIASFDLLPRSWSNLVAMILPPFEILCGLFVIVGPWRRPAALGIVLMNVLFIGVLGLGLALGRTFECGCFGKWDPLAARPLLVIARDVVFLAMAATILATTRRTTATEMDH